MKYTMIVNPSSLGFEWSDGDSTYQVAVARGSSQLLFAAKYGDGTWTGPSVMVNPERFTDGPVNTTKDMTKVAEAWFAEAEKHRPKVRQVFYTGDLRSPDGSDTGVYGDPCEEGHGETMESGWVDPNWSLFAIWEDREDVRPDVMDDDEERSPAQWLADTITDRLGVVESFDGRGTFYAADGIDNYQTGENMTLAAHAEGFTDDELAEAHNLMVLGGWGR